jgi:hypothetical protein
MFGSAKIKANCLGYTLDPMQSYSGLDLNKITNKENFELQEDSFKLLQDSVGKQKAYLELEMVCATWLAIINACNANSHHTFSRRKPELEKGFKDFLSVRINDIARRGMRPRLLSLLNK